MALFGFGARKKDVDIDELTMEQRVQDALARLQSGELEAVAPVDAASSLAPADPSVDYVLEALRADGVTLDRGTVTRVLTLGREFADKTVR